MENLSVYDLLHINGVILERARMNSKSLSYIERQIVLAGRNLAKIEKLRPREITAMEMEGEFDREAVLKKIEVKAVFAFYWEGYGSVQPRPDYLILESNHPAFPKHGNTDAESLLAAGIKLPKTPTYEKWVKSGSKVIRS